MGTGAPLRSVTGDVGDSGMQGQVLTVGGGLATATHPWGPDGERQLVEEGAGNIEFSKPQRMNELPTFKLHVREGHAFLHLGKETVGDLSQRPAQVAAAHVPGREGLWLGAGEPCVLAGWGAGRNQPQAGGIQPQSRRGGHVFSGKSPNPAPLGGALLRRVVHRLPGTPSANTPQYPRK